MPHVRDVIWYFSFSDSLYLVWHSLGPSMLLQIASFWSVFLTSLCVTGSRFIRLTTTNSDLFLLRVELYSIVYRYHICFTYSSAIGSLGCSHVLAIVNSAATLVSILSAFTILVGRFVIESVKFQVIRRNCQKRLWFEIILCVPLNTENVKDLHPD